MDHRKDGFRFIDHMADVGIEARAPTLEALFKALAEGLMTWIGPRPDDPALPSEIEIHLEAEDLGELAVQWLQELLYHFQLGQFYATSVPELRIDAGSLDARITGALWRTAELYREVKAVTYHQLAVRPSNGGWAARIILDV